MKSADLIAEEIMSEVDIDEDDLTCESSRFIKERIVSAITADRRAQEEEIRILKAEHKLFLESKVVQWGDFAKGYVKGLIDKNLALSLMVRKMTQIIHDLQMCFKDAIRENKLHGHITDASSHFLINIGPKITALPDSCEAEVKAMQEICAQAKLIDSRVSYDLLMPDDLKKMKKLLAERDALEKGGGR